MKRVFYIALFSLILLSCAQATIETITSPKEDRIVYGIVKEALISHDKQDTGFVSIDYAFYSDLDSAYKDSVNTMISNYIQRLTEFEGEDYVNPLSIDFFEAQADSFASIYYESMDISESGEDMSYGGVWDLDCGITIRDHFSTFVELIMGEWSYTGGAHGNGAMGVHMFDKSSGRYLSLEDFFSDINLLNNICEPYFRELMELHPDADLGEAGFWFDENKFSVNDNFSFSTENVIFHYNTYEIAPYSGGPTDLEIPISEIKHLLKRDV